MVSEQPIKYLGKVFDGSGKDIQNVKDTDNLLGMWLEKIEKSDLPGKFKAWCFQDGVLPRIMWPLMVYEVPMSKVEAMKRK